jgi:hypothetical protein
MKEDEAKKEWNEILKNYEAMMAAKKKAGKD